MKEKIVEILEEALSSVYCDSCVAQGTDDKRCEDCYRKNMNWGLSHDAACKIADEILEQYETGRNTRNC